MLFETLAVIGLISPISATSAWVLRNDVQKLWQTIILYIGPIIDAWFVWLLLDWLEMGSSLLGAVLFLQELSQVCYYNPFFHQEGWQYSGCLGNRFDEGHARPH